MKDISIDLSNKPVLRVFEAFAGVGSQHMALRNIGANFKVVGISEIDEYAIRSYNAIHGDTPNYGDITKINASDLPDMDLLTYSFPCQDLSTSGRQKGIHAGTRSGLLYECQKIIESKKPKFLLLENVRNLVSKKFKKDFDKWLDYLTSIGYKNYYDLLDPTNFGIPQTRSRVFVVSILNGGEFEFIKGKKTNKRIKNIIENDVDQKYYLSDEIQSRLILKYIDNGEHNIIGTTKPKHRKYGQRDDVYGINSYMGALMATDYKQPKQIVLESKKVRKLTPLECWRLMGFSDADFDKCRSINSDTQLYKQAGNSIVVPVLEHIFLEMLKGWN